MYFLCYKKIHNNHYNMEMQVETNKLLIIYGIQRSFIFLDEWSFYYILFRLYQRKCPKWIIGCVLLFGFFAITTAYKNLEKTEKKLGFKDAWLFWPFI